MATRFLPLEPENKRWNWPLANQEIDLILMDINLGPGMDGTEAAAMILEKREIPLAFLSSHTERDVVEKTEGITSYGYIVKNSGETVLLASMQMAFRLYDARRSIQTQRMDIEAAYEEMQVANEELLQTQHELIERELALKAEKDFTDAVLEGHTRLPLRL
jgi:DNA-binding NarL/FixJ family response regulator